MKFNENNEGAFRYWADCNSGDRQLDALESFNEGRRYEFLQIRKEFESYYTFQQLERVERERDEWKREADRLAVLLEGKPL